MRKLWQGVRRTVFWSYERGSWPYDIMVVAIVCFVLLTPRRWFHDQAQPSLNAKAGVELVSLNSDTRARTYRLDAHLLTENKRSSKATPELERETHDILGHAVGELQDQSFHVTKIDPVNAGDGSVLCYYVTVVREDGSVKKTADH